MLVLSRKRMEGLWIGDKIRITVVKIDRNSVRLGIDAPRGVSIIREELLDDIEAREARRCWNLESARTLEATS